MTDNHRSVGIFDCVLRLEFRARKQTLHRAVARATIGLLIQLASYVDVAIRILPMYRGQCSDCAQFSASLYVNTLRI
jgi:hypothetical protein